MKAFRRRQSIASPTVLICLNHCLLDSNSWSTKSCQSQLKAYQMMIAKTASSLTLRESHSTWFLMEMQHWWYLTPLTIRKGASSFPRSFSVSLLDISIASLMVTWQRLGNFPTEDRCRSTWIRMTLGLWNSFFAFFTTRHQTRMSTSTWA
jgi:hypothetical protein